MSHIYIKTTLDVLRELEWSRYGFADDTNEPVPACPSCGATKSPSGHHTWCDLAAAIRREESGGYKVLYDAAWAECQAQRGVGGYHAIRISEAKAAHDALRKEHGL